MGSVTMRVNLKESRSTSAKDLVSQPVVRPYPRWGNAYFQDGHTAPNARTLKNLSEIQLIITSSFHKSLDYFEFERETTVGFPQQSEYGNPS
jgi:hypothetical protein